MLCQSLMMMTMMMMLMMMPKTGKTNAIAEALLVGVGGYVELFPCKQKIKAPENLN